jgi:ParB family chromosome partitioning protein
MKKRALGKGLGALIPEEDVSERILESDQILHLNIDDIFPNRNQPRKAFDEDKLEALKDSIEVNGVIQPIIVTRESKGYQIIAGERRWRSARKAGLKQIPCIVRTYDDLKRAEVSIIENVQRDNLNPVEEAMAYRLLMNNYQLTQNDLSKSVGKSRPYITNMIRILDLDEEILDMIKTGSLTSGHGKALLSFPEEKRLEIALKAAGEGWSVRTLEGLARKPRAGERTPRKIDHEVKKLEEMIQDQLGTKVRIKLKNKKGNIQIDFYDEKDLERIIKMLLK